MKAKKVGIVLFILGLVLSGCNGKSDREKQLEKKITLLEQQIKDLKQQVKEKQKNEAKEEKVQPVVEVIDPGTNEIVKVFRPTEMGFETDKAGYETAIRKWAIEMARGTGRTDGYDQRMFPDKLDNSGHLIKGNPLTILDEDELVKMVMEVSSVGGKVELPLVITASGYEEADAALLEEVIIASYKTTFNTGIQGRSKNIELSAKAINNVILGVGDTFSFNTTLGPSDEAHGYQPAEEVVNGKLVMGIGGGICQTSSTLYNAIDQVGVEYVEKHHHSITVGYVPKGRDATVSYGGKDFRFKNTAGAPIMLKAIVDKGVLTVEVRTAKKFEAILKKGV